jgi:hypothetical protein
MSDMMDLMRRYDAIVVEKAKLQRERTQAVNELAAAKAELAATRAALQYARNLIGPDEIIDAALKGDDHD